MLTFLSMDVLHSSDSKIVAQGPTFKLQRQAMTQMTSSDSIYHKKTIKILSCLTFPQYTKTTCFIFKGMKKMVILYMAFHMTCHPKRFTDIGTLTRQGDLHLFHADDGKLHLQPQVPWDGLTEAWLYKSVPKDPLTTTNHSQRRWVQCLAQGHKKSTMSLLSPY